MRTRTMPCRTLGVLAFAVLLLGACSHRAEYVGRAEVIGEVETPGFYDVREGYKATKVVKWAGELDENRAKFVFLFHAGDKEPCTALPLNEFRIRSHEIDLKADDVAVFSRIGKPQVFLNADGEAGGALLWVPGMTVSDALNAADLEGTQRLRTGLRISRYGEKDVGKAACRADKVFPGDTILVYDLYQATVPKKDWIEKTPAKRPLIIGPGDELKGVEEPRR